MGVTYNDPVVFVVDDTPVDELDAAIKALNPEAWLADRGIVDLGTFSKQWGNLYLTSATISWANGDISLNEPNLQDG